MTHNGRQIGFHEARRGGPHPNQENRNRLASYIAHLVMYDVSTSPHDLVAAYHVTPQEAQTILSQQGAWFGPGGRGYAAFVQHIEKALKSKEWFSAPDPKAIPGAARGYGRYVWLLENSAPKNTDQGRKDASDIEDLQRELNNVGFNGWGLAIDNWPEALEYYNAAPSVYRRHSGAAEPQFKLGAPRPGTSVRDYEAVDGRDRHIAGPFKHYSDAKNAAGPGGHVKYVRPGARAGEARRGGTKADPRAVAFFRKNAGGVVGKEDESARALAHAEQEATARGWYVEWFDDPEGWDSLGDIDPETVKEVLYAVLKDENGEVLASLGSIADPDRTYGRVVEAELALEALSEAGAAEAHITETSTVAASNVNFQNGERVRIRVIGPQGQLADPPFWYTVVGTMSVEDIALQFAQTIQPGMFVSISDGKNKWTFQKETHGGQNAIRRTNKLPTARYREARRRPKAKRSARKKRR